MTLNNKTILITGGSRGIGASIAVRCAKEGANIAILAKTSDPHEKLKGTIHETAAAVEQAGGKALAVMCDVRDEASVEAAVAEVVTKFGGIDICINNASAISLTPTAQTEMKRYDLMHQVNTRGTFLVTKTCLPHLMKSENPHVLMMSPPLDMRPKWFAPHVAYTMAKYGMSMCVLGFAQEFKKHGIAVNALWPRTTIATAAIEFVVGAQLMNASRKPEFVAEAAVRLLQKPAREFTGKFVIDDSFLFAEGMTEEEMNAYRVNPAFDLVPDFFIPDEDKSPVSLKKLV